VRFPKDVVAAPSFGQRTRWLATDYAGLLFVLGGLVATAWVLLHLRQLSNSGPGP
jgi:cell division protein FtsX